MSLMLAATLTLREATSSELSECAYSGSVVGFFNGVWNDEDTARFGLGQISGAIGLNRGANGEVIQYELFYNRTGALTGASVMQDLAEVFIQRADEFDQSGELRQRWEFLWDVIRQPRPLWLPSLVGMIPSARSFFEGLAQWIDLRITAELARSLSQPSTQNDRQIHATRLRALALEGHNFVLVGHSQGSLFLNYAVDMLAAEFGEERVRAIHIAPASSTVRGQYWLADIDVVINSLRAHGGRNTVQPINLTLPFSWGDVSGHRLTETYLDRGRPARAQIVAASRAALESMPNPLRAPASGLFSVTLTWNRSGDLDLHGREPSGAHVYYASMVGRSGFLDYDNIEGYGPEHYYAQCDTTSEGIYRFGVNHYRGAVGALATVQVASSREGELATRSFIVGDERGPAGNMEPLFAISVEVARDPSGRLRVRAR